MFAPFATSRSRPYSLPLPSSSPWPGARRNTYTFIGGAIAVGILVDVLWFGLRSGGQNVPASTHLPPVKIFYEPCSIQNVTNLAEDNSSTDGGNWTLERIRDVAESSKGYYVRDYSLHLGWNNVRYIIETALLHSRLLDRTLVLPTYVYARACDWPIDVCAMYATMVNRNEEFDTKQWATLPHDQQMGWKIPLEMMIDIPHLRKTHKVILLKDWLKVYGFDPKIEIGRNGYWWNRDWWSGHWSGYWWSTVYRKTKPPTTIYIIQNSEYDPSKVVRVDSKSKLNHISKDTSSPMFKALLASLGDKLVLDWDAARGTLGLNNNVPDEEVEDLLAQHGWATVYTFGGAGGLEFGKTVTDYIRQAAPVGRIKGFIDDYSHISAKTLYLQGEIHYPRKPGSMRFTTTEARDEFASIVLHSVQSPNRVQKLAQVIHDRMLEKVDGRMWMAGHMRRGDFVRLGWSNEPSLDRHMERIKSRLDHGRFILKTIHSSGKIRTADTKGLVPDQNQLRLLPPKPGDPFYLATDETDEESRKWLREQGAILIDDVLTTEDRREFGWSIVVSDVMGVLEQAILGRSYYFYGHSRSSVAGGAVNLRAVRGADPRTSLQD